MSKEPNNSWADKAKKATQAEPVMQEAPRREVSMQSRGAVIMEIADRIWPSLMEMFRGKRDDAGMLLQPAHVRGIALNVAQNLMKQHEAANSN